MRCSITIPQNCIKTKRTPTILLLSSDAANDSTVDIGDFGLPVNNVNLLGDL